MREINKQPLSLVACLIHKHENFMKRNENIKIDQKYILLDEISTHHIDTHTHSLTDLYRIILLLTEVTTSHMNFLHKYEEIYENY